MDRLLFKLHYTQHGGTLHQHSDHFILGQDTFANFAKPNGGAALLTTCTVCLAGPLNPFPTHTHSINSLRQDVIQYFIDLSWQGVTEYAFQTKYATTNSNRDTGSTSSHCAFKFINQVSFPQRLPSWPTMRSTRGYVMACLCCSVWAFSWLDWSYIPSGKTNHSQKKRKTHFTPAMFSLCKYHLHYQYILSSIECCFCVCFRVVYTVLFDSWEIIGPYRAWWLLNGLLLVLQALHIIWFYLIARIAIKAIFKGKVSSPSPPPLW